MGMLGAVVPEDPFGTELALDCPADPDPGADPDPDCAVVCGTGCMAVLVRPAVSPEHAPLNSSEAVAACRMSTAPEPRRRGSGPRSCACAPEALSTVPKRVELIDRCLFIQAPPSLQFHPCPYTRPSIARTSFGPRKILAR